jgi:hypothetical protein
VLFLINKVFDKLDQQPKKYVGLIDFDNEHIYKDHVARKKRELSVSFHSILRKANLFFVDI